jgi:3-oxoacyl-(acyl-carrier-protein) synthase
MTNAIKIKAKITPWEDQAFVKAFEAARDAIHQATDVPDGARAGARVQHQLRDAGYPLARVDVIQTVDEKLRHTSHWLVSRDG